MVCSSFFETYEGYATAENELTPLNGPADTQAKLQALQQDAAVYGCRFNKTLQYNQLRVQHHIHPLDKAKGTRYLPNTCKRLGRDQECKHGFPHIARMNRRRPLLICKGIAKKKVRPEGKRASISDRSALRLKK